MRDLTEALGRLGREWSVYWSRAQEVVVACASALGIKSLEEGVEAGERGALPPGTDSLDTGQENARFAADIARLGAERITAGLSKMFEFARTKLEAEIARLPRADSADELRRLLQAIELGGRVALPVAVAEEGARDEDDRARRFKLVADALRAARQDVAQELLTEISTLVAEFYSFIHPPLGDDEITGAPEIEVQRRSSGTAHVRGKFNSKTVDDPRWVYSDGHLDTVGICVFLALRRFRADRDKERDAHLMILDDIVLSVDLAHGRRLLDLLKERFSDHQVMIFTHNGLFHDWCAQRLPLYKRKAISRWTIETGPQIGEYLTTMEHIEKQIEAATSPKLLAQAVMNLMDEWLAEARFAYALPVQAKHGEEYTLTEIWEPFCKRLKDLEKGMKTPIGPVKALLDALGDLPKMRNRLAAHDNAFAKEYPLGAVQETAKRAVELVRALYCAECTKFATPVPPTGEPDLFRCGQKCERIRFERPRRGQNPTS